MGMVNFRAWKLYLWPWYKPNKGVGAPWSELCEEENNPLLLP
jgi:hypothetical protein